ncbi:MAG: hypothetical protein RDU13_12605 [Elusimicrobiales bacterium]|nr:hypothetical protein [Elusimicrobiales bacterium]
MNGKPGIIAGILTVVFFCGTSARAEGMDTIGSLTETSAKISAIDMDKDLGEAGKILDSFYTGGLTKKERESYAVYAAPAGPEEKPAPSADIYTAAPAKVVIPGKVPPMPYGPVGEQNGKSQLPIGTAGLAVAALAIGLAGRKTGPFGGYFDNYGEDLDTVVNFITDIFTPSENTGQQQPNTPQHSASTNTVVSVSESSGTVVVSTSSDNSCVQSDSACYGSGFLIENLPPYPRP